MQRSQRPAEAVNCKSGPPFRGPAPQEFRLSFFAPSLGKKRQSKLRGAAFCNSRRGRYASAYVERKVMRLPGRAGDRFQAANLQRTFATLKRLILLAFLHGSKLTLYET
jgi:hypothetical protein